jgi:hypothetical protein
MLERPFPPYWQKPKDTAAGTTKGKQAENLSDSDNDLSSEDEEQVSSLGMWVC